MKTLVSRLFCRPTTRSAILCGRCAASSARLDDGLPNYALSFYLATGSMSYIPAQTAFRIASVRKSRNTVYIPARPEAGSIETPTVRPRLIRALYATKRLRHVLLGGPALLAKRALDRVRGRAG